MPLNELAVPNRLTGERQVRRALRAGRLVKLFIAEDADASVIRGLEEEALNANIPVERVESMVMLGRACAISRGASAAGIGS
ncbi:MAG: 50S ribosomal protein L7ae [Synergistaceae bacterium]|nr:ribosomal L7Ae/L30e/S12e/Gadd45 family protein [Synergistota bacterium]NLM71703.1 50S ribosomal protein L7ae [Synergistaceae bacterium]